MTAHDDPIGPVATRDRCGGDEASRCARDPAVRMRQRARRMPDPCRIGPGWRPSRDAGWLGERAVTQHAPHAARCAAFFRQPRWPSVFPTRILARVSGLGASGLRGRYAAPPNPRTDFLAMRPMRAAAVLVICGVARNDGASGPIAPTPFQLTVEPERQWSGGEIRLHGMGARVRTPHHRGRSAPADGEVTRRNGPMSNGIGGMSIDRGVAAVRARSMSGDTWRGRIRGRPVRADIGAMRVSPAEGNPPRADVN